jgi:hypothetical protein
VSRDIRDIKSIAGSLPPESLVRTLLQGEPDFMPDDVFVARSEVWVRAIFAERETARVAQLTLRPLPRIRREINRVRRAPSGDRPVPTAPGGARAREGTDGERTASRATRA